MLRAKNNQFTLVNGVLFIKRDRWITPIGPASQAFYVDKVQCRELLGKFGGLWVMWTDGFDSSAIDSDWYAVICRQHKPVELLKSREARRKIRKGLANCEVRLVKPLEIASNGYDTYCRANESYGYQSFSFPTAEEFASRVMTDEPFGDILHQWAVYFEGKMIAFAQNLIYNDIEVDYTLMKFHPDYLGYYPAYALIYTMNAYYLKEKSFTYVNDGFRSISHDTFIQDFLIKNFEFEKAYTRLHVHYRRPFGQLLQMARPLRALAKLVYPKVDALFELDRLRIQT